MQPLTQGFAINHDQEPLPEESMISGWLGKSLEKIHGNP
jgi:hypothetical protein